ALTPREAVRDATFVFTCVGNDDDLNAVIAGENGAAGGMAAGATLVDHTTTSADIARKLAAQLDAQGCHMLDAPVSGGQAGAENGALTIMVGGTQSAFDAAAPVMAHYARAVR
ncbi:MAG TPA: oxidoreductase, partial [Rhodobiaceae bacterium]|nr:oxidoreductase [Rhodobiaceae bacterium]